MYKKKATAISLPLNKTAKIMNSAVGVETVNQDIVALATKATEIFLMDFARRAYDQSSDEEFRSNSLEYDDIQKLVHTDSRYDFLMDTIPKRIKFSEALKLYDEANERDRVRNEQIEIMKKKRAETKEANKIAKEESQRRKQEEHDKEQSQCDSSHQTPNQDHDQESDQKQEQEQEGHLEVDEEDEEEENEENDEIDEDESQDDEDAQS